ncbi:MAG: hypothetical protein AAB074_14650 [Planctomycetota bacterium]
MHRRFPERQRGDEDPLALLSAVLVAFANRVGLLPRQASGGLEELLEGGDSGSRLHGFLATTTEVFQRER